MAIKIIRAYRTVSTEELLIIAGLIPLDLRAQEVATLYKLKNEDAFTYDGISSKNLQHNISNKLKDHLAKRINPAQSSQLIKNLEIYTDGSKTDDRVGCSYVMLSIYELETSKYKLRNGCRVFQAELTE